LALAALTLPSDSRKSAKDKKTKFPKPHQSLIPLAAVSEGEKAIIVKVVGGIGIRKRLTDLGLYEGTEVEMVKNDFHGPVVLKVLECRLAIGRGQALKIMTKVL